MSEQTILNNGSNQLFVGTDVSKIFLRGIKTNTDLYVNNSSYDPIELKAGTVMGRIGSTDILVPVTSTASDGSQNVLGILMNDLKIASGASVNACICVAGDVVADKLVFVKPGDGLDTPVSNRRFKDKIQGETVGINIVYLTENTRYDNY